MKSPENNKVYVNEKKRKKKKEMRLGFKWEKGKKTVKIQDVV
jgi:hypothetical protein